MFYNIHNTIYAYTEILSHIAVAKALLKAYVAVADHQPADFLA
jgi:hypothetical protein